MRKYIPSILVATTIAGLGFALSLTRTTVKNEGETGLKNLCQLIDANSVKLEALSGADITTGNIAVARITNAAASVGPSIGGNIPKAALTNALATAGDTIGGNIAQASLTNALVALKSTALSTNVLGTGTASTSTVVWVTQTGQLVSITTAP